MSNPVLSCRGVCKEFTQGKTPVQVLTGVDFELHPKETAAVVGASGCGKSTLLNVLGILDQATSGEVIINGRDTRKLKDKQKARIRNEYIGFVYQFHHLLPEFSALENVAMPLLLRGKTPAQSQAAAQIWLDKVGLSHRLSHKPGELSGGERQRVAIARALVTDPACVLMDEPTGNLDPHTAESVQELLWELSDEKHTAFVLVTHDMQLAQKMNSRYSLENGQLRLLSSVEKGF